MSLFLILKITNEVLSDGLSIPLVTAEADNSSAMEAERITIGTAIASSSNIGLVKIFLKDTVIPLNLIAL